MVQRGRHKRTRIEEFDLSRATERYHARQAGLDVPAKQHGGRTKGSGLKRRKATFGKGVRLTLAPAAEWVLLRPAVVASSDSSATLHQYGYGEVVHRSELPERLGIVPFPRGTLKTPTK